MKRQRSLPLIFVLVFLTASCITFIQPVKASENSWAPKAPMQQARAGLGVVAVNGKIYAIGGTTSGGLYPPDLIAGGGFVGTNEEYNPENNTWTYKAPGLARDYFAIAAYQNKIYCIGGAYSTYIVDERVNTRGYVATDANQVYDTVTDTWDCSKKPLPQEEMNLQANVVNGKIYVMGTDFTYAYDIANDSWTKKSRMPLSTPPSSFANIMLVAVGTKIIVTGEVETGFDSETGIESVEQQIWIYETTTDGWSQGKSGFWIVPKGAAGATTGVNAPVRVYVLGLADIGLHPPSVNQVYDPNADTWTVAVGMSTRRLDFGVAVINDVLYAVGGYLYTSSNVPTDVNEQYIPVGYETPDPSYQPPTPSSAYSPLPTSTPSPTPSSSSSATMATLSPSPTPQSSSSQPITPSPSTSENKNPQAYTYWIVGVTVVGVSAVLVSLGLLKKKKEQNREIGERK